MHYKKKKQGISYYVGMIKMVALIVQFLCVLACSAEAAHFRAVAFPAKITSTTNGACPGTEQAQATRRQLTNEVLSSLALVVAHSHGQSEDNPASSW